MIPIRIKRYILEIYILQEAHGHATISGIAKGLKVTASAASKMAGKLKEDDYIYFQPYGTVTLTKRGAEMGKKLFQDHQVLMELIGVEEKQIPQKVRESEMHLGSEVIFKIQSFIEKHKKNA
ncbi:MAG: metal-dependent transcriptional regulator [Bacillota bacterium]|uniref:metal-dependent transcriptional regulator n=1 Tax=Cytobacillus firmus TaxID=1399 RepID=UPI000B181859|nr:metal-dependent transcriptional regulator [Cytobacillus firmus]MEC1892978.1 metal-dependent transcriptional regulator [Cytobacillus firmus]MED4450181.1 metal-dependent transcriptional regulator [Cytobacillus firmus]MED4766347.1 metal-dependent transcriptional regulator [Cytobacillus firmus]SUV05707.1 DtxR familyiron (metal) dependent repressor [Cytobacillus firmus]